MMELLHAIIHKNAVEKIQSQTSLAFFNRVFLVTKPNNRLKLILDLNTLNTLTH